MSCTNITLSHGKTIHSDIAVISSKSELHRLIFCACLADRGCRIRYNSELSKDIEATASCFRTLGAHITLSDGAIEITKPLDAAYIAENITADTEIFCNESGSTARFILPLVSLLCKNGATLTGAGKLPQRPFSDLCRSLGAHGAEFSSENMPITVKKSASPNGVFEISGNISSQYLSGLLFILPLCPGCNIRLTTALESSGYVDMTIEAMKKFGIIVTEKDGVYSSEGSYTTPCDEFIAGGDWSNAAFFLCGAKEKQVTVTDISPTSLQPDRKILDILESCGFDVVRENMSVSVTRCRNTTPFDIDAGETPDIVPILAVLAASIKGDSIIRNIKRLRYKECDRVVAVCDMITRLGGKIETTDNMIIVRGSGSLSGGTVDSFNDHRIAMSAAIASCFCTEDVTINGAEAVSKSYPAFFEVLKLCTE